jgi:hypothetical protein
MKKTRGKIEGKDRLGGGARAVECCGPGQDTGPIQTRYAPGRSRFRSRRRGCPTLVSGEMPRTSGSGRSIGYTPRSAQLTVERILATRSAISAPDRRALLSWSSASHPPSAITKPPMAMQRLFWTLSSVKRRHSSVSGSHNSASEPRQYRTAGRTAGRSDPQFRPGRRGHRGCRSNRRSSVPAPTALWKAWPRRGSSGSKDRITPGGGFDGPVQRDWVDQWLLAVDPAAFCRQRLRRTEVMRPALGA